MNRGAGVFAAMAGGLLLLFGGKKSKAAPLAASVPAPAPAPSPAPAPAVPTPDSHGTVLPGSDKQSLPEPPPVPAPPPPAPPPPIAKSRPHPAPIRSLPSTESSHGVTIPTGYHALEPTSDLAINQIISQIMAMGDPPGTVYPFDYQGKHLALLVSGENTPVLLERN